ncbi:MAG: hypothetical protein ACFFFH_17995 [Candidatus Thorarchaeota archaeon]
MKGLIIFGSSTQISNPRDIDILIIVSSDISPETARRLRGKVAITIRQNLEFDRDLEIRVQSLNDFSTLKALHLGMSESYKILFDPEGIINKVFIRVFEIKKRWNTKQLKVGENNWILLPKGKLFLDQPINYNEDLTT